MFMPGIPQVWYLDLFAGTNDYEAVERAGADGHKEINRSNLSNGLIVEKLHSTIVAKQLDLIRLRNTSKAFEGTMKIESTKPSEIKIQWTNGDQTQSLNVDLETYSYSIQD